jgi:hypothetical protein
MLNTSTNTFVIPAKAGNQRLGDTESHWVPAFAEMTAYGDLWDYALVPHSRERGKYSLTAKLVTQRLGGV